MAALATFLYIHAVAEMLMLMLTTVCGIITDVITHIRRTLGWVLFGLALATIHKGIGVFADNVTPANPKAWLQAPASDLFLAYSIVSGVMIVLLELLHFTKYV